MHRDCGLISLTLTTIMGDIESQVIRLCQVFSIFDRQTERTSDAIFMVLALGTGRTTSGGAGGAYQGPVWLSKVWLSFFTLTHE